MVGFAAKDAVGASEVLVQVLARDILGGFRDLRAVQHAAGGECAQRVALVIPGIEIPYVAVVGNSLRRDDALGDLVLSARVVGDPDLAAVEGGAGQFAEVFSRWAGGHAQHPHPLRGFAQVETAMGEELLKAFFQRSEMFS